MAPTHVLVHLTDLHVLAEGEPLRDGVDTFPLVEQALQAVAEADVVPTALVFTGDLTEHGRPEQFRRLRTAVDKAGIDAPMIFVPGNHDERSALRTELLGTAASTEPIDQVVWVGDLRIVALDSTVPGQSHGQLDPAQIAWLRAELAEPAPAGTVLALHHPPLPTPAALAGRMIELRERAELGAAIAGSDVRVVLSGHTHVPSTGLLAGVPVWTGGPVFTTVDNLPPSGARIRTFDTPSVSRIDLFEDTVMASVIPLATPVFSD